MGSTHSFAFQHTYRRILDWSHLLTRYQFKVLMHGALLMSQVTMIERTTVGSLHVHTCMLNTTIRNLPTWVCQASRDEPLSSQEGAKDMRGAQLDSDILSAGFGNEMLDLSSVKWCSTPHEVSDASIQRRLSSCVCPSSLPCEHQEKFCKM